MSIAENLARLRERIDQAARRSGRRGEAIQLVAVTKTVPVERILEAIEAGVTDIGENRVQEAEQKFSALQGQPIRWHLVGHLQRNKAKRALRLFDLIHSVDSVRLVDALERHAASAQRSVEVLIEVNTSGEASKYGVAPEETLDLVRHAAQCEHVQVLGLMTIGPLGGGPEATRKAFRQLRELRDQILQAELPRVRMDLLSMGMTGDFEIAIEEGANIVRIGTAIFGRRDG